MNALSSDLERRLSHALLYLRVNNPFFATLALFARFEARAGIATAATDGRDILLNPHYVATLTPEAFQGLLVHEVLHCALLHPLRRRSRRRDLWNIAADIVVNGMIAADHRLTLADGGLRDPQMETLSVEEVYEALLRNGQSGTKLAKAWRDVLDPFSAPQAAGGQNPTDHEAPNADDSAQDDALDTVATHPGDERQRAQLEAYWKAALRQAETVARTRGYDNLPAGWMREVERVERAQLDWRSHLWRFLVRTPTDFSGFDRRFVGAGLYLDALSGETVSVRIAVDTSGSVHRALIEQFLGEVRGILAAYPHLDVRLWYADATLYGPYGLRDDAPLPTPEGGGGTSFVPFFEQLRRESEQTLDMGVAIYLTDGYGEFPSQPPDLPVLWVVAPGGMDSNNFPFGEVARLA